MISPVLMTENPIPDPAKLQRGENFKLLESFMVRSRPLGGHKVVTRAIISYARSHFTFEINRLFIHRGTMARRSAMCILLRREH